MVRVPCRNGDQYQMVPLAGVSREQYDAIVAEIRGFLVRLPNQKAVEMAFLQAVRACPDANPSDLWRHVLMQEYILSGRNDNSWKKASGLAFEHAFVDLYNPLLIRHGIRLQVLTPLTAKAALETMLTTAARLGATRKQIGLLAQVPPSKLDIGIDGQCDSTRWQLFGIVHSKTSIAERIKDDAPASIVIKNAGFLSVLVTLDHKCYPIPHGNGVNYGELGGRTPAEVKATQKRNYIEVDGDFHNAYSYNLRTPESPQKTQSGARIRTLRFYQDRDPFVDDLVGRWNEMREQLCDTLSRQTAAT